MMIHYESLMIICSFRPLYSRLRCKTGYGSLATRAETEKREDGERFTKGLHIRFLKLLRYLFVNLYNTILDNLNPLEYNVISFPQSTSKTSE